MPVGKVVSTSAVDAKIRIHWVVAASVSETRSRSLHGQRVNRRRVLTGSHRSIISFVSGGGRATPEATTAIAEPLNYQSLRFNPRSIKPKERERRCRRWNLCLVGGTWRRSDITTGAWHRRVDRGKFRSTVSVRNFVIILYSGHPNAHIMELYYHGYKNVGEKINKTSKYAKNVGK